MPTSRQAPPKLRNRTKRAAAGRQFVDALTTRDFANLAESLEPTATMRALLPRGPVEFRERDEIVAAFQGWFGAATGFEVIDTVIDEVGDRVHASWQFRVHPTPRGAEGWHVVAQHVFLRAGTKVEQLDLLCTGFIPDEPNDSMA